MKNYTEQNSSGELWIRTLDNSKIPAPIALSAVYKKYQPYSTFYSELTSNLITRFDNFLDTFFIETPSGYIFEKTYIEDNLYKPFNSVNLYNPIYYKVGTSLIYGTKTGYWYNERDNKILQSYLLTLDENKNYTDRFSFVVIMNEFDCKVGSLRTVFFERLSLSFTASENWNRDSVTLETPHLAYNVDTNVYNISFLIKDAYKQFGLISLNMSPAQTASFDSYRVEEINVFLPFLSINKNLVETNPYDPGTVQPFRVLTVSSPDNKTDPAYKLKYIRLSPDLSVFDALNIDPDSPAYLILE